MVYSDMVSPCGTSVGTSCKPLVWVIKVSPCGTSVGAVHETRMELAVCLVAMTLVGMLVPLRATAVKLTTSEGALVPPVLTVFNR